MGSNQALEHISAPAFRGKFPLHPQVFFVGQTIQHRICTFIVPHSATPPITKLHLNTMNTSRTKTQILCNKFHSHTRVCYHLRLII